MNKWQFAVYSTSDTLAPAGEKIGHGNIDEATQSNALNFIRRAFGLKQKPIDPEAELDNLPKNTTESSTK